MKPSVADLFFAPPLNPAASRLLCDATSVALGTLNVTNPAEHDNADRATVAAYAQVPGPAKAASIDTTHGLVRVHSDAPFLFISGIVNRIGVLRARGCSSKLQPEHGRRQQCGNRFGVAAAAHRLVLGTKGGLRPPIPLLIHSAVGAAAAPAPGVLPIRDVGTTYSMAQEVRWLDDRYFAIGRWDGSLTVFNHDPARPGAPVISAALVAPSLAGVEMISRVMPKLFASSNDAKSIVIWQTDGTFSEDGIRVLTTLTYDPAYGPANDGAVTTIDGKTFFVSGHASGFGLVWHVSDEDRFELVGAIDLRSAKPIPSPYPLKNICGVEAWRPSYVATGSEDGDLCLVRIPHGDVIARCRYNPSAQRGIHDIDVCSDYLVVANCSVGDIDKNLWLFEIGESGFTFLDARNLKVKADLDQVFNFCVEQGVVNGSQYFFSVTQEGVVWVGLVENRRLSPIGTQNVSTNFGAALSYAPDARLLAVAGDNLHLFELQ